MNKETKNGVRVCMCVLTLFILKLIPHYTHNAFPNATTARIPRTSPM